MTDELGPPLPIDWEALAPLVDRLLDAPPDRRATLLTELSAGDPARRAELERLVAECERELPLLDRPAVERFDQLIGEDSAPPLPPVLGERYRIERELGRGGMARVYLAQDLKHSRQVAIKVIRPELAASLGRDRFLREIGIAARLRHPNIMPLYDSGDAEGVLYFVMPYEQGLSLRARLERDGALPIAEGVNILREVARALAYAHEQGVVHRDVKPDNVMLSGDAAVVTDFGIAKAVSAALTDAGGSTISQVGSVIGTPAYMAPEQATGDPATDHRADIYSFGCLAYEVFTGKPPFTGASTHQLIAAHLSTAPRPVTASRTDVPSAVAALIASCLEKDPAARPQSAQELLGVLGSVATADRVPIRSLRVPRRLAILLGVVAIVLAITGYLLTRGPVKDAGLATVAVLPLLSQGGDSVQALVAEGFSDDIRTALVKYPWVRVMSRRGAANYRGQRDLDLKQIGKELGVRYLVTGTLTNIAGHLSVLVQLMSSENDALIWGDRFERTDTLSVLRDQIAKTIGDSLYSQAGASSRTQVAATTPVHRGSNEAYRLYIMGKEKLNRRGQDIGASIGLFRDAIALDSLSPDAYSGLGLALALAPYFQGIPADSVAAKATAAARRALQLDPKLAEPHTTLGLVLEHDRQWDRAESEFKTALTLDSNDVEARVQYGRHLIARSRIPEALKQFQAARDGDPASAVVSSLLSHAWDLHGQMDSALAESARAQRIDPGNITTVVLGAMTLLAVRRDQEAHQLIKRAPPFNGIALYVLAVTGDRATVLERLNTLASARPAPWLAHSALASAMLGFGDTAQALDALERATEAREIWPTMLVPSLRMYDGIRGSARFRAVLTRVGLSPR